MILLLTVASEGFTNDGWRTGALATRFATMLRAVALLPTAEASVISASFLPRWYVLGIFGGYLSSVLATCAFVISCFGATLVTGMVALARVGAFALLSTLAVGVVALACDA